MIMSIIHCGDCQLVICNDVLETRSSISDRFLELQKKKFIILDQIKSVAKE